MLLQIVALVLTVTPSITNSTRFLFMMLGPAVCAVLFILWLLLLSRLSWKERLTILMGITISGIVIGQFIHSTTGVALWIYGIPLAMALSAVLLWIGRRWTSRRRTWVVLSAVVCGWCLFLPARIEGFDGSYWPKFRWRWRESGELRLARDSSSPDAASNAVEPELTLSATDWPGFRGPRRDGRVTHAEIAVDWSSTPPRQLWRTPVGPAWSSFAGVGDLLFTQEQRGEAEMVVCYSADSGKEIWRHADDARFFEVVSGPGPRATPTFADGRLYTFGGRGLLNCLNARKGELLWQRDVMVEVDAGLPMWGFAASPLVTQGTVIVHAGGSDGRGLLAYDALTGDPMWHLDGDGMNYSSAQLATLSGRELVVFATTAKIIAIEPQAGRVVWQYDHDGRQSMAIVQPQQVGEKTIIVPFGDGGGLACIDVELVDDQWQVTERWQSNRLKPSFNDFVYHDGHLYGFDQNIFTCIDARTGERCWKQGRYGFGQVLLFEAQGILLVTTEQGSIVLLGASPGQHTELARFEVLTGKTWNHPIIIGNRLVLRNGEEAVCYDLPTGVE
jgi:outer membrane protein assembly factor BamB